MRYKVCSAIAAALSALPAVADVASATETITYTYDAKGRLAVTCDHVAATSRNSYAFDKADNRTRYESYAPDYTLTSKSSADGRFTFVMQGDGNLVLYQNGVAALWATSTFGSGFHASMQWDGNLVVYDPANAAVWNSQTNGNSCATLRVQNDGNVVIANAAGVTVWSTNTGGH